MMALPQLQTYARQKLFTEQFTGYNHNRRINDGEMYDETNLSSDLFPMLCTRKPRGDMGSLGTYGHIMAKQELITIRDGTDIYYGDQQVTGVQVSASPGMQPKKMVSMGAYVCIWPDKVYLNTVDLTDCGYMGASWTQASSMTVHLCRRDGTAYSPSEYTISSTAPTNPANGALWVDTSKDVHVLRQYNAQTAEWIQVATTYVRLDCTGIGKDLSLFDGVEIRGMEAPSGTDAAVVKQIAAMNGSYVIYLRGDDYIVLAAMLDSTVTIASGVSLSRDIPDLDYVTECDNRIWGCRYGQLLDGSTVNEIRACALGDFRNWEKHLGISTDSYTASCGTDGKWTGAATLKGSPIFFKESCLHRVSGYQPSNYQIVTTLCRGVQDGSWKSLCVVGEALLYKGRTHVMSYDGSQPTEISYRLGDVLYFDATAGANSNLYFISMRDAANNWNLFVYDNLHKTWHRQDDLHAVEMATVDDELYVLDADGELWAINGTQGELEDPGQIPFEAVFGVYGYEDPNQKYLTQFIIRAQLVPGSEMEIFFQYDSDGTWESAGKCYAKDTRSFNIPILPRRCDHCQMRIAGRGSVKIISVGRTYKDGGRQYATRI